MSSSQPAPLKKFVIERNVDLSGKSREELAAATQVLSGCSWCCQEAWLQPSAAAEAGLGGGETASKREAACACCHTNVLQPACPSHLPPPAQDSCAALRQVGTDRVQWRESYVCKDK